MILDNWLIHFLNHLDLSQFVSGLTVPKLNQGNLNEIPIPVPPLPEQQRIVCILDEAFEGIAAARANAEKNLQNARALFESYLQAVFSQLETQMAGLSGTIAKNSEALDATANSRVRQAAVSISAALAFAVAAMTVAALSLARSMARAATPRRRHFFHRMRCGARC